MRLRRIESRRDPLRGPNPLLPNHCRQNPRKRCSAEHVSQASAKAVAGQDRGRARVRRRRECVPAAPPERGRFLEPRETMSMGLEAQRHRGRRQRVNVPGARPPPLPAV